MVRRLFRKIVGAGKSLFVPITVALELEWVLRSRFGFAKPAVLQTFSRLLSSFEVRFESEGALEIALRQFGQRTADFSDCVDAALAHRAGGQPLWTFDKAASKVEGAQLLTSSLLLN